MTRADQTTHLNQFHAKQTAILTSKGDDYNGDDRLGIFKIVAQIVGITPEQVVLVFEAVKVVRTGQLLQGKTPNNESIDDSVLDGACYWALLDMVRKEPEPYIPGSFQTGQVTVDRSDPNNLKWKTT